MFSYPDDQPEWVKRALERIRATSGAMPEQEPEPTPMDAQKRCAICGSLILEDAPEGAETCTAHRKFEHLQLLVRTGEVTDWTDAYPPYGHDIIRHIAGVNMQARCPAMATVATILARYNGLNGTRYHL